MTAWSGLAWWEHCTQETYRLRNFAARNADDSPDLDLAFTVSGSSKLHREGRWKGITLIIQDTNKFYK